MKLRKLYLFSIYASESLPYHYLESFPSISFCEGFKMLKMSLGFFNLFYSLSSSSRIIYNISHWFSCWKRKGFSKRSDKLFIDDIIESTLSIKKSRVSYTISWDDRIKAFNIWSIFCFHCLFHFLVSRRSTSVRIFVLTIGSCMAHRLPRIINCSTFGIPKKPSIPFINPSFASRSIFSVFSGENHFFICFHCITDRLSRRIFSPYISPLDHSHFSRVSIIIPILTPSCQSICHTWSIDSSMRSRSSFDWAVQLLTLPLYSSIRTASVRIFCIIYEYYIWFIQNSS